MTSKHSLGRQIEHGTLRMERTLHVLAGRKPQDFWTNFLALEKDCEAHIR